MAATCKTIVLKGDPKKPESATHVIEFPGGYVEVSRTTSNEYWVHIGVVEALDTASNTQHSKTGKIISIRSDKDNDGEVEHFSIRIGVK